MGRELVIVANAEQDVGGFGELLNAQNVVGHQPTQITAGAPIGSILFTALKRSLINRMVDVVAPFMGEHGERRELGAWRGLQPQAREQAAGINADLR